LLTVAESPNRRNARRAPCTCENNDKDAHACARTRFTGPSSNILQHYSTVVEVEIVKSLFYEL
jgi:hypothetical protein